MADAPAVRRTATATRKRAAPGLTAGAGGREGGSPAAGNRKPARDRVERGKSNRKDSDKEHARHNVVRDSFTMPMRDYALIGVLKKRCIALGVAMKKSELLRAGLSILNELPDGALVKAVAAVQNVKTGRPPAGRKPKQAKGKR